MNVKDPELIIENGLTEIFNERGLAATGFSHNDYRQVRLDLHIDDTHL